MAFSELLDILWRGEYGDGKLKFRLMMSIAEEGDSASPSTLVEFFHYRIQDY